MKTAVSIPDEIFEAADRAAKKPGISSSELYAATVDEYVKRHRSEDVTIKLNEVYASNDSNIYANLQTLQLKAVAKEDW